MAPGPWGVMVGRDAGGSSVGVAPDAKWIAVKIFNDQGRATSTAIDQGFQWLLDPDGDRATADAPDVVNDSWTMSASGCLLDFQPDLASLRAVGILPVFAAGNYGPLSGSSASPANNPEAFAIRPRRRSSSGSQPMRQPPLSRTSAPQGQFAYVAPPWEAGAPAILRDPQ